jgi:YVTN family beta-propeller protein
MRLGETVRLTGFVLALALTLCAFPSACAATASAPLVLEATIALDDVNGRIDHLAYDPNGRRLVVAELENNSVDVIDLSNSRVVHRITGVREPQGVAFDQPGRIIAIAGRADGSLHLIDASTFSEIAALPLGSDADNVRIDPRNGHIIVGYGDGALAVVDLATRTVHSRITLPAHPESFQIDPQTGETFVNLPDRHTIGVVDLERGTTATWRLPLLFYNFPMALDPSSPHLASAFRLPARLVLFDRAHGTVIASEETCGDSDDLFFDARRHRIYVACGAGRVDVFEQDGPSLRRIGRAPTRLGARTALFIPELDRLYVAAPTREGHSAGIMVFKPIDSR